MCPEHQRRLDKGGGLPPPVNAGDGQDSPSPVFGILDIDDTGIRCSECGQRFANLGIHIRRAHQMNRNQYADRHGVRPVAMPPHPDGSPRRKPRPCYRCKTTITTPGKLCPACKAQRQREIEHRRSLPPPQPKTRPLTLTEIDALKNATADELPELVARLQRDRVRSDRIADVLGLSRQQMSRRYPRPNRASRRT